MVNLTDYIFSSDLISAQLLLDRGADINAQYGKLGIYPICSALNSDNPETLKFVIKKGANPNIENGLALFEAFDLAIDGMIQHNLPEPDDISLQMISILLENGANPEIKDITGKRPLDIISDYANNSEETLEQLKNYFRPLLPNIDSLLPST